ncbi:hypothetical protein BBJ28_00007577 [Nothophytophthora sp. Chile5]|nr:hypothetical protein BBJ28_00007577 [Nothophytophthora sp. Chile5]
MLPTTLFSVLVAALAAQASASGSSAVETSVGSGSAIDETSSASSSSSLAPIDTASSTSATFQLVESFVCETSVSDTVYVLYNKNRALFDVCVNDAQYQIFPFLGTHPTAAQVEAMASSTSCIAVFTGVELANFPQCDISGMPLKAAVETLLKIHVDLADGLAEAPSATRFQQMMAWRRDVNLAQEAGVPFDSDSELYQEYADNLWVALTNTSIRVLEDYTVEYQLASGSWISGAEDDDVVVSSGSDDVGTVSAGDGSSEITDSAAGDVGEDSSAATGNTASSVVSHGAITALAGLLLSALLTAA